MLIFQLLYVIHMAKLSYNPQPRFLKSPPLLSLFVFFFWPRWIYKIRICATARMKDVMMSGSLIKQGARVRHHSTAKHTGMHSIHHNYWVLGGSDYFEKRLN